MHSRVLTLIIVMSQMKKSVAAGSEQKAAAQKAATKGLDALLASIQGAKKVRGSSRRHAMEAWAVQFGHSIAKKETARK